MAAAEVTSKENTVNQKVEVVVQKEEVKVQKEETKATNAPKQEERTKSVSSNAFASGANMNSSNVITDRPSSRVLAPPGGHCSIRLG